ncbi:MAG: polyhydroxyalkanoate depolymerase [Anderseniella sp.]
MLYMMYEMNHAAIAPLRMAAKYGHHFWTNTTNPVADTELARSYAASLGMFERLTRRYGKPEFAITSTEVDGKACAVQENCVWDKPFCRLLNFNRQFETAPTDPKQHQKILIVAPMSGHYSTLLRGTVESMLPHGDVYITDWVDARDVPASQGSFDLDDYIDYVIEIIQHLGQNVHVMAVCQPTVPVLAAISLMHQRKDKLLPASMMLMGGPIDTRRNPTTVNELAVERGTDWFKRHVIVRVPFPNAGFMRRVYPGFLQLTGFMSMNLDRHVDAHRELFRHLVEGDEDSAEKQEEFYDEYLSVMDLTAEFYLQTVDRVFVKQALPKGEFYYREQLIEPASITETALMTIEGEKDDISGIGQSEAAHELCTNLPKKMRDHHLQEKVGHYGVFNGSRFRAHIVPRIVAFMHKHNHKA